MRLLLDTHIALWAVTEPERLTPDTRVIITNPSNDVLVSLVAVWEIAIKRSTGRIRYDMPSLSSKDAATAFIGAYFDLFSISFKHIELVETLPRHHGDPFDRLMVAQAQADNLTFMTHDKQLAAYGDFVMVV